MRCPRAPPPGLGLPPPTSPSSRPSGRPPRAMGPLIPAIGYRGIPCRMPAARVAPGHSEGKRSPPPPPRTRRGVAFRPSPPLDAPSWRRRGQQRPQRGRVWRPVCARASLL
jgi:hypothetical protein